MAPAGSGADPSAGRAAWLHAGVVGAPHGLDGGFHVSRARPALLIVGASVKLADVRRTITHRGGDERRVVLRVEGCDSRDTARKLGGAEILVARSHAPELGPDEWWAEDLEGCVVHDREAHVGVVRRMLSLPSCEVLEVERPGTTSALLVPLVSDAVRSVDITRGLIDVDLAFLGER